MTYPKDDQIIAHLRRDGRCSLTHLSKIIKAPVSTIFDRIKTHIPITDYRAMLDFSALGFGCRALVLLRTTKDKKTELGEELANHPHVNSLHRINNGLDYCAELIFRDLGDLERFLDSLEERFIMKTKEVHYLLEDLRRESFLSDPHTAGSLLNPKRTRKTSDEDRHG